MGAVRIKEQGEGHGVLWFFQKVVINWNILENYEYLEKFEYFDLFWIFWIVWKFRLS